MEHSRTAADPPLGSRRVALAAPDVAISNVETMRQVVAARTAA